MTDTAPFLPQEVIINKRDGLALSRKAINQFVAGIADQSVTDAQIAAFGMAVFLNGMTPDEGATLTMAMRDSGDVIDWTTLGFDRGAPIVDKHSTGGVGDKVSLMLAPIVAAAGGYVPMISGRGLGHSGGTLDKFEAIPGYNALPDIDRFAEIVRTVGCSVIGQTGELAPADKRFYAVRDVTGTVESIPLITASILSKKLAAGLSSLVMDVKFGNGAFMKNAGRARALAENIVRVAKLADTPVRALLTDMNQVLGRTAGNSVEMIETLEFLESPATADERLLRVTLDLAAHMLDLSDVVRNKEVGLARAKSVLETGQAQEVFARMVVAHGGPADLFEKRDVHLPLAAFKRDVRATEDGYISSVDTRRVGMAVVALGGGRTDPSADIDHGVGLTHIIGLGERVSKGDPIATVYARDEAAAEHASCEVLASYGIGDEGFDVGPAVLEMVD